MSRDPLFRADPSGEVAARHSDDPVRPRIGVWGRFDSARFEDLVQPWIVEREIRRRLPESELETYAPLGEGGSITDPGFATVDLDPWSSRRAADLSSTLDLVVVTGELFGLGPGEPRLHPFSVEGLGRELEASCPVTWSAVSVAFDLEPEEAERLRSALAVRPYLSVRDEESLRRLRRAGVETEVALVPDPLLLLPRVFPADVLARRLEYLKHMAWFPRSGEPLVIQPAATFGDRAEDLAATFATALERSPVPVVLLELTAAAGDGRFAEALSRHSSVPVFRVPPDAGVADTAAVLAHSRAFVGTSARTAVALSAYGVPALILDGFPGGSPRELIVAIRSLLRSPAAAGADPAETAALDLHFDRLAGLAESAVVRRLGRDGLSVESLLARLRENERTLNSWRLAYEARTNQVVDLRLRWAQLAEKEQKLSADLETLQAEAARRHHAWAAVSEELATERAHREAASNDLARTLDESRARAAREKAELSQALEVATSEAARHEKRAAEEALSLRTELDRVRERLEKARSDHSDLRTSQTLLLTEIAEARADAGHAEELADELRAELERLQKP